MRTDSTDISKIIVLADEETKDCFFTAFGVGTGICSVRFKGILRLPMLTELFLARPPALTPAAPNTTLAVEVVA